MPAIVGPLPTGSYAPALTKQQELMMMMMMMMQKKPEEIQKAPDSLSQKPIPPNTTR